MTSTPSKKSAFDVLMNRTNKIGAAPATTITTATSTSSEATKKSKINSRLDDSDIIILNEEKSTTATPAVALSSVDDSAPPLPPHVEYFDENFFQHTHQYVDEDLEFIKALNSLPSSSSVAFKPVEKCVHSSPPRIVVSSESETSFSSFCFKNLESISNCECKHLNDGSEENVIFSVNNSLDYEAAFAEIVSVSCKEEKVEVGESVGVAVDEASKPATTTTTTRTLRKKVSSSSMLLKHPSSKRRRTEKPISESTTAAGTTKEECGLGEASSRGSECELWTEKYQFKDANEIVTNKAQLERLREWLNNWKSKHAAKAAAAAGGSSSRDRNNNKNDDDSDYSYSSSGDDNSDDSSSSSVGGGGKSKGGKTFYPNAIILAGPHGSGKTSSVYAVAKELGFKLFEVNASSLRSKSHIIQELEGALDSHHVSNNRSTAASSSSTHRTKGKTTAETTTTTAKENVGKIETFFKPSGGSIEKRGSLKRSANDDEQQVVKKVVGRRSKGKTPSEGGEKSSSSSLSSSSSVNVHKESLILFDEIEVVFKEDAGFWATVTHFVKKSKKPIVITTNDEFIRERMNLNVERIEFERPRVDACVRFLVSVAKRETNAKLETATAYEIVRESRCDMRKSLVQLQTLISGVSDTNLAEYNKTQARNGTLDLAQALSDSLFLACQVHNQDAYFENVFFLDALVRRLHESQSCVSSRVDTSNSPSGFKPYDKLIVRDGLTDNGAVNAASSAITFQSGSNAANARNTLAPQPKSNLWKINGQAIEHCRELFSTYITMFNRNKTISLAEWTCHGAVNRHGYSSAACVDRVAQALGKFSNSGEMALDYRPYLHEICRLEDEKQQVSGRKRFLHYLNQSNVGLLRDDFALLAKSNLAESPHSQALLPPPPPPPQHSTTDTKPSDQLLANSQLYDTN